LAGPAEAGGPAGAAGTHAQHHRPRRPAPGRAQRGNPGRTRNRFRGPRPHEGRRSLLMLEPVYQSNTERVQTWLEGRTLHIRFSNPARHKALTVDMWGAVP